MKQVLLVVAMMFLSAFCFAQSQFFCKTSTQTSIDSWQYRVYKAPDWSSPGPIQINLTFHPVFGSPTSTGWQPFTNGQVAGGTGNGGYTTIEIRIVHIITGNILYQFEVTNYC